MGNFRSKLAALGMVAAVTAIGAQWTAEAQQPQPIRLSELEGCGRDLRSNPSVNLNPMYRSAIGVIADARARARDSGGVPLDAALLQRVTEARNECRAGLRSGRNGPYVADAYDCDAEGSFLLAQQNQDRDTNFREAACKFAALAHVTRSRAPERSALAGARLGDALQARTGGTSYPDLAIRAYDVSVRLRRTAPAYQSLALAYTSRGQHTAADGAYASLLELSGLTGEQRASALAGRARAEVPGRTAEQRRAFWRDSFNAQESGEAAVGWGQLELANNRDVARDRFRTAAGRTWPIGANGTNYQLEGRYYLSVLDSPAWRVGSSPTRAEWARAHAHISDVGLSQPHYRRQTCLTHIGRGGDDYNSWEARDPAADQRADDEAGRACTAGSQDAEGQLLIGMYWLRRAQYSYTFDNRAWENQMRYAEEAFRRGSDLARGANNRPLNWPDNNAQPISTGSQPLMLADALQAGERVASYRLQLCRGSVPANAALFQYYGDLECRPSRE